MQALTAQIPARSRSQVLDWSLVLISQGIESVPEQDSEQGGWRLIVAAEDYDRALEILRCYHLENRRWPWRHVLFEGGAVFDWAALAWSCLEIFFYWLSTQQGGALRAAGIMDSSAVRAGQWWRLFTAMWLHGDLAHLAANATLGLVLLGLALGRCGTGWGMLLAYLAGAGGNVAAGVFSTETHLSLGASGMVMGALGLLGAQSISLYQSSPQSRKLVATGFCGGLLLFVLLGVSPGTDIVAHGGGFVGGLLLGGVLNQLPRVRQSNLLNSLAGLLFVALVILPWWLALKANSQ